MDGFPYVLAPVFSTPAFSAPAFSAPPPIAVILVKLLLSEYAIEKWFNFLPHLFSVRALPWEILRPRKSQT